MMDITKQNQTTNDLVVSMRKDKKSFTVVNDARGVTHIIASDGEYQVDVEGHERWFPLHVTVY